MPTVPPLYRFPIGDGRRKLFGKKTVIGDIDALCRIEAAHKVAIIHGGDPADIEVLTLGVKRQLPTGEWVPTDTYPETRAEAILWAKKEGKEAADVPTR